MRWFQKRVMRHGGVHVLVAVVCMGLLGCERRPKVGGVVRFQHRGSTAPNKLASAAPSASPAPAVALSPEEQRKSRYENVIRPILLHRGCAGGACHSRNQGGGFHLSGNAQFEIVEIMERFNKEQPEKSLLLLKATAQVQHNGGRNMDPAMCDYKRLLAWLTDQPDLNCSDDPPKDPGRFAREVGPALSAMECTTCHSDGSVAQLKFDLSSLRRNPMQPEGALAAIERTNPSWRQPYVGAVVLAAMAKDGKHQKAQVPNSCAFRRLYAFLSDSPEVTCDLAAEPVATLPDIVAFRQVVQPGIAKRGCYEISCHGSGSGGMQLNGVVEAQFAGWHDYLVLLARVEDRAQVEKSTLLQTARNKEPHGGGQRLGGAGDCIDQNLAKWLQGKPVQTCPAPPQPSFEQFVKDVQPTLDKMTCTQAKCHGGALDFFKVMPHPTDEATLRANYKETLAEVDLDFSPFSQVQLRMREPCAYAKVAAWIDRKPSVKCEIVTPPPSAFPRLDGNSLEQMHQKMKPGAPSGNRKT